MVELQDEFPGADRHTAPLRSPNRVSSKPLYSRP